MPKFAILAAILLILLCACNQSAVSSSTSAPVEMTSSQISASEPPLQAASQPTTSESEAPFVPMASDEDVDENVAEEQVEKEKLITELMEQSVISIKQGKDNYFFCSYEDYYQSDKLYCRMIRSQFYFSDGWDYSDIRKSDKIIEMEIPDNLFGRALDQYGHEMELSYNFERGLATFTIEKNNYHLDFNDGTITHEEKYSLQDLDPNYLIGTSPDGKLKLFATYIDGGGESQWGDYVILNTETQEILYLTEYSLFDKTIFIGSDKVQIVRNYGLDDGIYPIELLDVHTGNSLPNVPKFEYGKSEIAEGHPKYTIVGLAYDNTQNKTLIAYRETDDDNMSFEPTFEVYLAVYDEAGNQINTVNTGFMMQENVYSFPNSVRFESADNGVAVLSTLASSEDDISDVEPIELGSVSY